MPQSGPNQIPDDVVQQILRATQEIRFGSVEITIHEGRITQIERREKLRFGVEQQRSKPTAIAAAKI